MADAVETMLVAIEDELKDKVKSSNNYNTDPTILRGFYTALDVPKEAFPAICFTIQNEQLTRTMSEAGYGIVNILFYGYSQTDGSDKVGVIRELAHDTIYFLFNEFSYRNVLSDEDLDIRYFEGSTDRPSGFTFEINIKYDFTNPTV
jgi:hypothetical protein